MQIVQRFVLARLRYRRFFSLDELNAAIRECVADLNAKIMRKLDKSRRELFETIERPALKALPAAHQKARQSRERLELSQPNLHRSGMSCPRTCVRRSLMPQLPVIF